MRLSWISLFGLLSLFPGAFPGSRAKNCAPPPTPAAEVQTTSRLVPLPETLAVQDDLGTWTLGTQRVVRSPELFETLSLGELSQVLERTPHLLGTASMGKPNRGRLLNGLQLSNAPYWEIRAPERAFGTPALVDCLQRTVSSVHEAYPGRPLILGDMSNAEGGFIPFHRSHQSGLDVDFGYYYLNDDPWYTKATNRNLDVPRTWALVRAVVTDCEVAYLFSDLRVMSMLREHAEKIGEDPVWLKSLFSQSRTNPGLILHSWGHQTHFHLRVHDVRAEALGARLDEAQMWARTRRPPAGTRP